MIPPNKIPELKRYLTDDEIRNIEMIISRAEYEDYFFKTKTDVKWLFPLKILDYFDPKKNPLPLPADKKGYFTIPEWNVLQYLEKISEKIGNNRNDVYINELLNIIRTVTLYRDKNDKHIDNYRTWWYFIKILLNLPNDKIMNDDLLIWLPIWLDSNFDTTLQGYDIALRLLPKFLNSDRIEDKTKAETILETILAIKNIPLDVDVDVDKDKEKLTLESCWIEKMFNKYGKDIGEKCSKEFVIKLSDTLKPLLYAKKSEMVDIEGKEGVYIFTLTIDRNENILLIQSTKLSRKEVRKIDWSNGKIDCKYLATIKLTKISYEFLSNIMKEISNNPVTKNLINEIGEDNLKKHLYWLITKIYNFGTYSSFYTKGHPQYNTLDLFTEILKTILNAKALTNREEMITILEYYLDNNYMYFKKMALYIIGKYIQQYKDIFYRYLNNDEYNLLLDGILFGDELGKLFNNLTELNFEEKKLLKNKIEQGCVLHSRIYEEDNILWKQERYQALSHIPEFKTLHDEIKNKTKINVTLRPAVSEMQTGWVEYTSPIKYEELSKMSVEEVIKYIKEYKPLERIEFFKIEGVQGLADEFSKVIQKDPGKFTEKLFLFQTLGYFYIYKIIGTFRTLWKNKSVLDIDKILHFIKNYISMDEFGKETLIVKQDGWNAGYEWVIGIIGEFIQEVTKDDEQAFDEKYFIEIKEILFICFTKIESYGKTRNNDQDPVINALNTHQGKIITALIFYALRVALVNEKKNGKKEINWENDIKTKYEEVLNKKIIDAYTLFGLYILQLNYLDRTWVANKINEFESLYEKQVDLWESFMTGYLHGHNINNIIFEQMNTHYIKGLDYEFKNSYAGEGIVQHIAIGYLRNIPKSIELFEKLKKDWIISKVEAFIKFLWTQTDYILKDYMDDKENDKKTEIIDKIKKFWQFIFDRYKNKMSLNDEDKGILSDMCLIVLYIVPIDESSKEWIKLVARHVEYKFNSTQFIESLNKMKNIGDPKITAGYIGEIFNEILYYSMPTFPEELIRELIKFIKDNNQSKLSNNIIDNYEGRGVETYRDLYER